jgi:hypothetical protein
MSEREKQKSTYLPFFLSSIINDDADSEDESASNGSKEGKKALRVSFDPMTVHSWRIQENLLFFPVKHRSFFLRWLRDCQ